MLALLNPRVLIALALAAILAFSHFSVYRMGKANVRNEWNQAIATANAEARKLEQQRQRRADEAASLAARRAGAIAADARAARLAADGLRGDILAIELHAQQSIAAANESVRALGDVLQSCTKEYLSVAAEADAAYSEVKQLRDAWPR